ncbi:hypothetical protein FAK_02120 [Desulfoferula mesophila]|uniref:HTH merR-type domain-containing protein n=2 Tax=Desulfoferula mesophila TaxID=3058419 RepID=A0AAU9ER99_9BACT|nr:hypothetical protein FAK_02120 [Desulfoferula mesophilus]
MYRITVMKLEPKEFSLDELCTLTGMSKRTVRFYIQRELVDRPLGSGKGAHYTQDHLSQLLTIRKWKKAGLSLERISELLREGEESAPPPRPRREGAVEVWSHLNIADGVELHIQPGRAGLGPEEVRELFRKTMEAYRSIKTDEGNK